MDEAETRLNSLHGTATLGASGGGAGGGESGGMLGAITAGVAGLMPGLGGAAMGLGMLGATGALAFGGVAKAVSAAHQAATNIGETQQQLAATEFSNSVAIRQAQQSLGAAHLQAAQDAQQAAEQITQSQMSLAETERNAAAQDIAAQQAVAQAEHGLADAQYTEQQAQVSLTEARIQARIQLQQLQDQVKDAALSEQAASLAVQQAKYQQQLTDSNAYSTSLDRQQAALAVAQAEQQLTEAQQNKSNVTEEASSKDQQYFDGQQQVIQAEHALKDAIYGVTQAQQQVADSQRNLRDTELNSATAIKEAQMAVAEAEQNASYAAQRDAMAVKQAQQNVTDTIKEQRLAYRATMASANQSALQYAKDMARLTPAGRQMVREILSLRGAFDAMIHAAQGAVAPGIDVFLHGLKSLMPDVTRGVREMGHAISVAFGAFGRQMDTKSFRDTLNGLIRNGIQFAGTVLPAVAQFIQELGRIGGQKGAASGLASLLAGLVRGFTGLARVIGQNEKPINQILTLIGRVLTAAGPALGQMIGTFTQVLSPITRFLNSPGGKPFVKVLGDIVGGFLAWKAAQKLVFGPLGALGEIPGKIKGGWVKLFGEDGEGGIVRGVIGFGKSVGSTMASAGSSVARFVSDYASKIGQAAVATGGWIAEHAVATAEFVAQNVAQAASATAAFIAENAATLGIGVAIAGLVAAAVYLGTHWKQVWDGIKDIALDVWHNVLDPAFQGIAKGAEWLYDNAIKPNFQLIQDAFHDVASVANWLWHNVLDPVWQGIESGARAFVSGFETVWHRLESVFKTPVNFLIGTVYDKGIARLWNDVVTHIGLSSIKLPVIAQLAHGGVVGGGPDRGYDTEIIAARPGEGVLIPEATQGLGGEQGISAINQHFSSNSGSGGGIGKSLAKMPVKEVARRVTERPALHAVTLGHFASGGVVGGPSSSSSGGGGLGGWLSGIGHDITSAVSGAIDVAKIVAAVATGNTTAFTNAASKLIGTNAAGDLAKMMIGVPKTLVTDAAKELVSMVSSSSGGGGISSPGPVSGTVAQWFAKAVKLTGVGAGWIPDLETIAHYESGDNPNAINLTDSNAAAGDPSRGIMQCVALTAEILTKRGWLTHEQVMVGDETLGYNPQTGRSEWTVITKVVHYENAEVWRIGNRNWHADVTPNHRWWSDSVVHDRDQFVSCPECGWAPRGTKMPSRGVQVRRRKIHGLANPVRPNSRQRGEFVRTDHLTSEHRLRLAAPATTDGLPSLSLEEVRIIAWLQGDGTISTARSTTGEFAGYDGRIFQSKPEQVVKIRALLAAVEHHEAVRDRRVRPHHLPGHVFTLRRGYVTDLLKRSGVMETGPEAFVLALSPEQRAAWLDAMIDAEGHRMPGRKAAHREFVRIAQVDGPLQDAIKLAVFLEGYRPTYSANSAARRGYRPGGVVGMAGPHVAPSMFSEPQALEPQTVWCVKTGLETWTARQDGQIFLTGNTIMSTFLAYHQPGTSMNIYDPVANIAAAIRYIKARYSTVADVPGIISLAHGGGYVGYDSGGWLMPTGLMPGPVNATGQPEAVLTPAESAAFVALVKRWTAQPGSGGPGGATVVQNFVGGGFPNAEQQAAMKREMALALAGPA